MSSVLNTSTSALLAFQRALTTVSHNVANINTEGYSRQTAEFSTSDPSRHGSGYIGNGTRINDVRRVADQLAITRLIDSNAEVARLKAFSGLSDRVDMLMSDSATNLESSWSTFFDSVSGLSSDASSTAQRQNTLDTATALVERFRRLTTQMDSLQQEVNNGLVSAASEINRLTSSIADLNRQIGANPNKLSPDLLDRRDAMANELVSITGGSISLQDGVIMNVYAAGGSALVVGTTPSKLTTIADPFQPERLQLALSANGLSIDLSDTGIGGSVGGLLDFRKQVLDPTQAQIGQIALGLAEHFNAQQTMGVDLYGQRGEALFGIGSPTGLASSRNTGNASLALDIPDLALLESENIRLTYNGNQWQATKASTGELVPMTGAGTAANPLVVNGIEVVVQGTVANGDQFLLKPTAGLAGSLTTLINDPGRLAAAAPVQVNSALGNIGTAKFSGLKVTDGANPALAATADIVFTSSSQYTINGSGPFAYTPGSTISANGWAFQLDGAPATGDTFTVRATPAGSSDNTNASLLAAVEDLRIFANGTQSLTDAMAGLTTRVGTAARGAEYSLQAATAIQQQAQNLRDSVSGVNLDEEAAQMLKLQQAYQAASQLVSTADNMFQTILGAVSR